MLRDIRRFIFILAVLTLAAVGTSMAAQGTHRTTPELKKDLRDTNQEFKKYEGLLSKLNSSAKQSSNTARQTAVHNLQDFMGKCIQRREADLGDEITLKQHGKMVKSGTTDVADVGAPVPGNKRAKGSGLYDSSNSHRMSQLSNMKSLYVSAKNNSRPAIERQEGAFDRYLETVGRFGNQLEWAANGLQSESDRREAEAEAEAAAKE